MPDGKKYSEYKIFDGENPLLTFIFLELPRFTGKINELEDDFLEQWMYMFKNMGKQKAIPEVLINTIFERMFLKAETAKMPPNDRDKYEQSLKRYRDMEALLKEMDVIKKEKDAIKKENDANKKEIRRVILNYQQIVEAKDNEIAELRRRLGLAVQPL